MPKKIIVISLGGSLIIPHKININLLKDFKKTLIKNSKNSKFIIVCGGGQTARDYIKGLDNEKIKRKEILQSYLGIASTRLNARFMTYFFGEEANEGIPMDMKQIKGLLKKNKFIFCGALRYAPNQTSDSTAAKLAKYFKTEFINLTNVKGLFDKNPKKFRSVKFIPEISHKDFLNMTKKVEFKPGQHFALDQTAAKVIKKYNITTYILGQDFKNLDKVLNNKHFIGTMISS